MRKNELIALKIRSDAERKDRDCRRCKHNTRDGNAGLTPGCYAKLDVRWPECWEAKR